MNAKSRMAIFAACTTACHLAIAEPTAQAVETLQPGQWTAEQFRDAKPLEAPAVYGVSPSALPKRTLANSQPLGRTASSPSSAPTIALEPNYDNKLFDYVESAAAQAEYPAQPQEGSGLYEGKYSAYFTSARVTPAPAAQSSYPYSATGKLYFKNNAGEALFCTGVVIAPRLVLTAGQCVYDMAKKAYYKDFKFEPGFHKGKSPYGSWEAQSVTTTKAWIDGKGKIPNSGDFAILEMKDDTKQKRIGDIVGWYGWRIYFEDPNLNPNFNHITTLGYYAGFDKGEWMHRVDSNLINTEWKRVVLYGSDIGAYSQGMALIENFGERSEGQLQESGSNRVLAVASFHYYVQESPNESFTTDEPFINRPGLQGAILLNDEFLSLYDKACAIRVDNCKKK